MHCDDNLVQVLILGGCFMLIATSSRTTVNIQKTVLESVKLEDESFHGDAYVALAIVYAVYSLGTWIAPSVVALIGPKYSLISSAVFYLTWIASFLIPIEWLIYLSSALNGLAAAVLWTAQGNYLSLISNATDVSRNSCIFWALLQCNMFIGNAVVFFEFYGKDRIDAKTRNIVIIFLCGICTLSILSFFLLKDIRTSTRLSDKEVTTTDVESTKEDARNFDKGVHSMTAIATPIVTPSTLTESGEGDAVQSEKNGQAPGDTNLTHEGTANVENEPTPAAEKHAHILKAWRAFLEALHLFTTPKMLFLSATSLYTGLAMSFQGGVFSSSVGFTLAFKNSKSLVGLMGILVGLGAVTSSLIFGILGQVTRKKGSTPIIILGLLVHSTAYVLVYLTLPDAASNGRTYAVSYFTKPSVVVVIFCALSLGFGDSCFQTQMMALLASVYSDKSAAAFALFKFVQSLGATATFAFSSQIGLHTALFILLGACWVGALTFIAVEHCANKTAVSLKDEAVSTKSGLEDKNGVPGVSKEPESKSIDITDRKDVISEDFAEKSA